jgi:nucleotide-binding universal stress UspA family protein
MSMFRTILCPVDASTFSQRALRHAVALARASGAEIVVMSVRPPALPPSLWLTEASALPVEEPGEQSRALDALRVFVRESAGVEPDRAFVVDGSIVPEVLNKAAELPADLIVMGTHGLGGFDRLILGSVTEKILRKARCPVLTVPRLAPDATESADTRFSRIVCGVDRSLASQRALECALSFARQTAGELVMVHVLEDISAEEPRFARHFNMEECWRAIEPEIRASYEAMVPSDARQSAKVSVRVPFGKAYKELLAAAADVRADLIVLGTAGSHTPFGATTQHVVREATCPVLTVPPVAAPS